MPDTGDEARRRRSTRRRAPSSPVSVGVRLRRPSARPAAACCGAGPVALSARHQVRAAEVARVGARRVRGEDQLGVGGGAALLRPAPRSSSPATSSGFFACRACARPRRARRRRRPCCRSRARSLGARARRSVRWPVLRRARSRGRRRRWRRGLPGVVGCRRSPRSGAAFPSPCRRRRRGPCRARRARPPPWRRRSRPACPSCPAGRRRPRRPSPPHGSAKRQQRVVRRLAALRGPLRLLAGRGEGADRRRTWSWRRWRRPGCSPSRRPRSARTSASRPPCATASPCPPSAASACTAAAVALVSTRRLGVAGLGRRRRGTRRTPRSSHCCPASQSTAFAAGFTPTVSWASRASDCRQTPSYFGSLLPYRPEGDRGRRRRATATAAAAGGGRAEHGGGGERRGAAADVHDRRVPLPAGSRAQAREGTGAPAPYTSTVPATGGCRWREPVTTAYGAFRLTACDGGSRLRVSAGFAPASPRTGMMTTRSLYPPVRKP